MAEKQSATEYFSALDGLKAIGFLIVYSAHIGQAYKSYYIAGKVGVSLFFVLSAFFLTNYFAEKYASKSHFRNWRQYIGRRIFRLYPMYVVVLLIEFITRRFDAGLILSHLLLLDGRRHYWVIPVEFQFYVLMPFMAFLLFKLLHNSLAKIIIALIGMVALYFAAHSSVAPHVTVALASQTNVFFYIFSFLVGIGLSVIMRVVRNVNVKPYMYVALLSLVVFMPYSFKVVIDAGTTVRLSMFFLITSLLWAVVIVGLLTGDSLLKRICESRILTFLGKVSYSAYLIHIFAITAVKLAFPDSWHAGFALGLLGVVVLSYLSYRFIEEPARKFGYRIVG